ncbi:DUF1642 domain-containing protein [Listeria monocytogenes]|uniref:DUF1642 domain-containing protein n=1 Tax=Listeria monocytogenes TaxID=1639 RepID=UPI000DC353A1|nr:DUF1642 domain-containing protein [Listeria monocytogenes]EAC3620576.1 DUF1642 domain-containing protein [Listeria monocytogenes]EAC7151255.1 DUF1642 domain-containing protein [Listeria monocytogenes]EAF4255874.1 DUF1642 domain-containing protein [Listeria monocytogenes]EAF4263949.1 DUF1642 domain-containing protein [Listeria monocytogenes]EAF6520848.1 DUF1642 domain-containing protein [Listeria monocytogenes]
MRFREGDRVELILRSKKRVGTVEEVYNDTQKCKVQIDGFLVTVTKLQKYLVKVEGAELVLPKCVADWLNHCKQEGYNLFWSKKEPLYYVKLPISKRNEATDELEVINMCLLLNIRSRETCISGNYRWVDKLKRTGWRTKLTEAQIKNMPGGNIYWQFAVLVEEVDGEDNE